MIDSESREDLPRTLGRGEGITSLPGHPLRFLRVLYEGGRPYLREDFDWNVCLSGLSVLSHRRTEKRPQGIEGGPAPIKDTPFLTHKYRT